MDFKDFIQKYSGRKLEVTGSSNAKNQCVDLANGYIRDVLGAEIIEHTNAQDFPQRAGSAYDFVEYRSGLVPEYGDIVVWNLGDRVGHIAVFYSGNSNDFTSFDQNWPLDSTCHLQDHTYNNVKGWLRFNQLSKEDMEKLDNYIKNNDARMDSLENLQGETKLVAAIKKLQGLKFGKTRIRETLNSFKKTLSRNKN